MKKTTVDVIVTDEKDYEIVDLRVGDTKTYTDKTGNYSDSTLDGLDKKYCRCDIGRRGCTGSLRNR